MRQQADRERESRRRGVIMFSIYIWVIVIRRLILVNLIIRMPKVIDKYILE